MKRILTGVLALLLALSAAGVFAPVSAEPVPDGLYCTDGTWRLAVNGETAVWYTGLYCDANLGWWLVENGTVNTGYTGLYCDPNVGWWLLGGGTIAWDYTGLWYDQNCGWWLIGRGQICFDYNGLWDDPNLGRWMIRDGRPTEPALPDGLHYDGDAWRLYMNGEPATWYTGLYGDAELGWWLVENGTVNAGYTGLYCDPEMGWWLLESGTVSFGYTGLYCDANLGWWFISGGAIDWKYKGLYCDANVGWWLISGGTVARDYTGLWNDSGTGRWLISGGAIAFGYTGTWNDPDLGEVRIEAGRMTGKVTPDPDPEPEDNRNEATYVTLRYGSKGPGVRNLVKELANQGFYTGAETESYNSTVESAVRAFQKAKGLKADGIAGPNTQHALFNTVPVGEGNHTNTDFTIYPVEKIDWYTGGINELWTRGSNYKIYDVKTGLVWWAHRWAGGLHVDAEPLTAADTAVLCRIYGVSSADQITSKKHWQRRPCLVTIGTRTFACSLYGVPHNYPDGDTISDNDFKGQLCIHFTNSKTHGGKSTDPDHQAAIQEAYDWYYGQ